MGSREIVSHLLHEECFFERESKKESFRVMFARRGHEIQPIAIQSLKNRNCDGRASNLEQDEKRFLGRYAKRFFARGMYQETFLAEFGRGKESTLQL